MDYRETNRRVIEQFRAGGPIDGMHRDRILLLTTTGRRSGDPHTTPMMFHREGGRLFVIASNVGAPTDPEWCLNLRERTPVFSRITELYPFFVDHQRQAPREIPVVVLSVRS